jgi:hypothetical protein
MLTKYQEGELLLSMQCIKILEYMDDVFLDSILSIQIQDSKITNFDNKQHYLLITNSLAIKEISEHFAMLNLGREYLIHHYIVTPELLKIKNLLKSL